jgi:hypothetical protein
MLGIARISDQLVTETGSKGRSQCITQEFAGDTPYECVTTYDVLVFGTSEVFTIPRAIQHLNPFRPLKGVLAWYMTILLRNGGKASLSPLH